MILPKFWPDTEKHILINRFQEVTVFIEIKKNVAGDSELKASRISFRINRENRVLFGPARFLCAQFAFQPPLAPTFQLVHVSTGTVVCALVFLGETDLTVNYKGTHSIHRPPSCHEILEGKHEAFRKRGSRIQF